MKKIAFAGTDGRTLLSALIVATAKSDLNPETYQGVVVRGTPAMPRFAEAMNWPVHFIPTASNAVGDYAESLIQAMRDDQIDVAIPMPEALLFEGLVDRVEAAGFGDRVIGLNQAGAFIEGDKLRCKKMCREAGIPVAPEWYEVDARDYKSVLQICLELLDGYGGAVLKYPYSAGGKGARIIRDSWQIREVYDALISDYREPYKSQFGKKGPWPLLIESLMSGAEISFTILADGNGDYRILPTAMDYPERFEGPAGKNNPITGGVGAISPHPMESPELIEMAGKAIAQPLIESMKSKNILRPCILYPGCFVSLDPDMRPTRIRVSEINIRPGEPEAQPVARRIRNLGALIEATAENRLKEVVPEIRDDQVAVCIALVTGPGGPDGQKGYPWSCTKGEPLEFDFKYLKRKAIQVIPSAMTFDVEGDVFKSDGTRVAFINVNGTVNANHQRGEVAERLRQKLLAAFDNGKIRVIPREDPNGNRLDLRRDVGRHFGQAEKIFSRK